jgi:hypothetical protein
MLGPFRYQAASGDCFPTSVVNALTALYPSHEIPSAIIQHVYLYTLDDPSRGGGTSDEAGRFLCNWLTEFSDRRFRVKADFLTKRDVDLSPRGKIERHLMGEGVATFDTYNASGTRHSILILSIDAEWAYGWDPRHRPRAIRATRNAENLHPASPSEPNVRVRRSWLEKPAVKAYTLGPIRDRCAILFSKR